MPPFGQAPAMVGMEPTRRFQEVMYSTAVAAEARAICMGTAAPVVLAAEGTAATQNQRMELQIQAGGVAVEP